MKKFALTVSAVALALGLSGTANATISVTVTPGSTTYTGPTPTYDFDSPGTTPVYLGGSVVTQPNTSGHAQPVGSTGYYYSVGPSDGEPGTIVLSMFGDINAISFIWGS